MVTIDKDNNITMTRGDTVKFNIGVLSLDNNSPYVITSHDIVTFTMREYAKKNVIDDNFVIQKEAPLGALVLNPQDTADLAYKTYHYDIQIELENSDIHTIIAWRDITFGKEST